MTDLDLERQIRLVLANLELLSHGTTASWNPSGGRSAESSAVGPPGDSRPPHLIYRARFDKAVSDDERRQVLRQAEDELLRLRGGNHRPAAVSRTDAEILADQILEEGRGSTPAEVSQRYRCTPGHVRRVRMHNGRNSETGAVLDALSLTDQQAMVIRREPQAEADRPADGHFAAARQSADACPPARPTGGSMSEQGHASDLSLSVVSLDPWAIGLQICTEGSDGDAALAVIPWKTHQDAERLIRAGLLVGDLRRECDDPYALVDVLDVAGDIVQDFMLPTQEAWARFSAVAIPEDGDHV